MAGRRTAGVKGRGAGSTAPAAGTGHLQAVAVPLRAIPIQARAKQSVDQILDAAAILLDEVGLDGFNTNLLARRAGVLVRTVYRYFPDKYAVILALAQRLSVQWEDWTAQDFAGLARTDWEVAIRPMLTNWVKRVAKQPAAISVIKAMGAAPELREFDLHLFGRMVANMEAALRLRGITLPEARLRSVCRATLTACNSGIEFYFGLNAIDRKAYLDELTNLVLAYLSLYLSLRAPEDEQGHRPPIATAIDCLLSGALLPEARGRSRRPAKPSGSPWSTACPASDSWP